MEPDRTLPARGVAAALGRAALALAVAAALAVGTTAHAQTPDGLEIADATLPAAHELDLVLEAPPELALLEPTRAVLRLVTTEPLACVVAYGTDASFGNLAQDPAMGAVAMRDHEVTLDDLEPDTTYLLRFQGSAADGTFYASPTYRLRTPGPADERAAETEPEPDPRDAARIAADTGLAPALSGLSVAEVSSEFGAGFLAEAALNDMPGEWSSAGDGDDAFLTVALPEPTELAGVTVHTRTMADSSRTERFRLVTSDGTVLGPFDLPDAERPYAFAFETPVVAATVRFEVVTSNGGNTGLARLDLHPAE